jgi:hypothetical protein
MAMKLKKSKGSLKVKIKAEGGKALNLLKRLGENCGGCK